MHRNGGMTAAQPSRVLITAQAVGPKSSILQVWPVVQELPWEQNLRPQPRPTNHHVHSSTIPRWLTGTLNVERASLMPDTAPHHSPCCVPRFPAWYLEYLRGQGLGIQIGCDYITDKGKEPREVKQLTHHHTDSITWSQLCSLAFSLFFTMFYTFLKSNICPWF